MVTISGYHMELREHMELLIVLSRDAGYMVRNAVSRSTLQARKRAIVKTLCYRLFMVILTVIVAWLIIGNIEEALNIGIIANLLKMGTYYIYERIWDHITWGISVPT